jgi:hypothetical protein
MPEAERRPVPPGSQVAAQSLGEVHGSFACN